MSHSSPELFPQKLSTHFSLAEFERSTIARQSGIDNTVKDQDTYDNLLHLAAMLEIVRTLCGDKPIIIHSGYRCPELNSHPRLKGSFTSLHLRGLAADFNVQGVHRNQVASTLMATTAIALPFEELILEPSYIHIAFLRPSRELLTVRAGITLPGLHFA